ncbi:24518_t:CDS:2, partial [Gigaspora margarita]
FAQSTIHYSNFTYQETSVQPNLTGTQPHILHIEHYNDNSGTAVVRIGRANYFDYGSMNYCYERRLLLRVIKPDGSVIEINYEDATEIQDINYCTTNWHPNEFVVNNITPKKGFLRLSTINGIGTNPEFFKWSQYGYNGNGSFSLLACGYALIYANTTSRTFTSNNTLATQFSADAGIYAIMLGYNQSTTPQALILYQLPIPNLNFTKLYCSVDFVYIGHSCIAYVTRTQTSQIQNIITTVITTTITPIAATPTVATPIVVPITTTITAPPTTITNSEDFYVKMRFLSTGSVIAVDPMFPQNKGSLTNVRTLPYGGYALIDRIISGQNINYTFELYNESDASVNYDFPIRPLITNFNGAFDILQNNTMLVALNETTTYWKILSIQLPSLSPYNGSGSEYGNLHVNGAYPPKGFNSLELNSNYISITYQDSITFNDGSLKIYQKTSDGNKTLRQLINTKSCNLGNGCNVSGNVVTLKVLGCAFNNPNAQYYIEMDNNFIKSKVYNEPILGIDPDMWIFNTANIQPISKRSGDIHGALRLTNDGTQYFNRLNKEAKDSFFDNLIKELTILIPTENGRLNTNKHTQKDPKDSSKIIISVSISEAKGSDKLSTTQIQSNLILLVTNKEFTGISTGSTTKYLDETYGYQRHPFAILYSEKSDAYVDWFVQYGRVAVTFALASGANIDTLLILRANLMNFEMFRAPFSDASLTTIFWGACADALLTEIPQFIIQIIFLNSSVLFDAIPIFALVASGLSVLASITSKIFFIKYKAYSPYLSRFVEKRRTSTLEGLKVNRQTFDTNEVADTTDGN